ncbi:MAG: helix-turn-helix domain-containing protein [Proteobacteria bacterium]|nr:helix-turn-helix domain-containing protein [Pseudomonadota bacterium]
MSEAELRRNFGQVHALHVAALTRHLVACRRACDGDLDLFLVLTIIGERSFTPRNAPSGMSLDDFAQRPVSTVRPEAINLQSIADYSGIPRESVRRKLAALVERGWVQRDARGYYAATDGAKDNLSDLTNSSLRYLRDMAAALTTFAVT